MYWPYRYIVAAVLLYLTAVGFFYAMQSMEKKDILDKLFEQNLENRRREISEIKLSAAKPYIWKPLLLCNSINYEMKSDKEDNLCVKTAFKFLPQLKNEKYNFYYSEDGFIHYLEKPPKPCSICHQKNLNSFVLWTFSASAPEYSLHFTNIIEHAYFTAAHLIFFSVILFYLLLRVFYGYWPGSRLTSAAFIFPIGHEEIINVLSKIEKKFIYLEKSDHYFRGYLPRHSLVRWVKKNFTHGVDVPERDINLIRASAILLPAGKGLNFSLEGIRIAHTMALRSPSGCLMVHDKLISRLVEKSRLSVDKRKGIWKVKNQRVIFYLLSFKRKNSVKNEKGNETAQESIPAPVTE
ncbi:MAG: hypothetical protein OEZ13_12600 [Spirochaetia bacterium]|nr:hypothetical protein [Spirochaetia bacterium]